VIDAARVEQLEAQLSASQAQLREAQAELAEQKAQLEKLEKERDDYLRLYRLLLEQNELLKRGLLGQKAERLPPNDAQMSLAILNLVQGEQDSDADQATPDPSADEQQVQGHSRRKPKRQPLPEELPRISIELVPPEVQRAGLDAFELIGTEKREVLERRPASLVVVELLYPKYVPKKRERDGATQVLVAETVELPIERGLAGPGMLADTVVHRWQNHLPLHRLEGFYAREGLPLSRSTVCCWHEQLAVLAGPVVEAMFLDAYQQPYLCVDATGVLVQAKERCRTGHFWVLVAPELHVLYRFSERHDGAAVDELLAGYAGYLVADAHVVYDHLYATGEVIEVGCWAHARRYYFKAVASDPERAKHALAMIAALFRIEKSLAGAPRKKKERVRQRKSKPIVEQFFGWCDSQVDLVLDESPIAKAIGYARNQREALQRFLKDGRLPLHNNISELNLRREAVGRKNWIFLGSPDGGKVNTIFVSLLASCAMHKIEPFSYLRDLFCLLPSWPRHRVLELAPAYWQKTLQQPATQQLLAANVFRQAILDLKERERTSQSGDEVKLTESASVGAPQG